MGKWVVILLAGVLIGQSVHAGSLGDSGASVSNSPAAAPAANSGRAPEARSGSTARFSDLLDLFFVGAGEGARSSLESSSTNVVMGNAQVLNRRLPGDPLLPVLRLDSSYQAVVSDIDALDYRLEGGHGPVGLQWRHTHYWEHHPSDSLDLMQVHGLLRLSFTDASEIDLGVGGVIMAGTETHTGPSFTIPITLRPVDWLALEFRPQWAEVNGNSMSDYDLGLSFGRRFFCLRSGYRWVNSPGASLKGPYFGAGVQY